jgi:hypothetical protein
MPICYNEVINTGDVIRELEVGPAGPTNATQALVSSTKGLPA